MTLLEKIWFVKNTYEIEASVEEIEKLVQLDYEDGGIELCSTRDILEILFASGVS